MTRFHVLDAAVPGEIGLVLRLRRRGHAERLGATEHERVLPRTDAGADEIAASGADADGPFFDVAPAAHRRRLFAFKFVSEDGEHEPDYANRLWVAADGPEVWTHSRAAAVARARPVTGRLLLHYRQQLAAEHVPHLHVWQEESSGRRTSRTSERRRLPHRCAFAVEGEDEHTNGGRDARLRRGDPLGVPDFVLSASVISGTSTGRTHPPRAPGTKTWRLPHSVA